MHFVGNKKEERYAPLSFVQHWLHHPCVSIVPFNHSQSCESVSLMPTNIVSYQWFVLNHSVLPRCSFLCKAISSPPHIFLKRLCPVHNLMIAEFRSDPLQKIRIHLPWFPKFFVAFLANTNSLVYPFAAFKTATLHCFPLQIIRIRLPWLPKFFVAFLANTNSLVCPFAALKTAKIRYFRFRTPSPSSVDSWFVNCSSLLTTVP